MAGQSWWADGVDVSRPSAARVYDVHLGGSHNFRVDRELAEESARLMPSLPAVLRENRSFLRRVVDFLARSGVTQFLDLGSGIPTIGNVHEIAQRINPECRVVYVDWDLVAVAHSQAILRGNARAVAIRADFREPGYVLAHHDVERLLDLSRPVAVLFFAVLHFLPDSDDPAGLVARYVRRLASGSYVALSHACDDDIAPTTEEAARIYGERIGGFHMRSKSDVAGLFGDLPLVPPGLVDLTEWRPDSNAPPADHPWTGPGGVARKP
ncbi:SAM-dependent methyltransferase [Saccharopolyspora rosea]|uniref:SAM-dependent methyltransferase n=2 Tax=Saccharopolyspora rosea TaxID=524884 RepID=A0ABW3FQV3_9PSEU